MATFNNIETIIPKEDFYDLIQERDYYNTSQRPYISDEQNVKFRTNKLQQTLSKIAKKDSKINDKINVLIKKEKR